MLDQLSGGRLDLGIGRGAVPLELSFFGVSAAEAQDRYSEAAEIVIKAMETDTLRTAAAISTSPTCRSRSHPFKSPIRRCGTGR